MAWDDATGQALGRGAQFLKRLQTLGPGQRLDLHMQDFQDMLFPVGGGLGATWEEKVDWLRERSGFRCLAWQRAGDGTWVFEHSKPLSVGERPYNTCPACGGVAVRHEASNAPAFTAVANPDDRLPPQIVMATCGQGHRWKYVAGTVTRNECEHGSLRRSCLICERDDRIRDLEAEARSLRQTILTIAENGNDLAQTVVDAYARNGRDLLAERHPIGEADDHALQGLRLRD